MKEFPIFDGDTGACVGHVSAESFEEAQASLRNGKTGGWFSRGSVLCIAEQGTLALDVQMDALVARFSLACTSPESLEELATGLDRYAENQRNAAALWRRVGTERFTDRKGAEDVQGWTSCAKCMSFGTNSTGPAAHIPGCGIRPELRT
jgi:hypothetical protein